MNTDDAQGRLALATWTTELSAELGVDPAAVDIGAVLALAGVVAHAVVRPAAPVSTYLAGLAAGAAIARGTEPAEAFAAADSTMRALAARTSEGA